MPTPALETTASPASTTNMSIPPTDGTPDATTASESNEARAGYEKGYHACIQVMRSIVEDKYGSNSYHGINLAFLLDIIAEDFQGKLLRTPAGTIPKPDIAWIKMFWDEYNNLLLAPVETDVGRRGLLEQYDQEQIEKDAAVKMEYENKESSSQMEEGDLGYQNLEFGGYVEGDPVEQSEGPVETHNEYSSLDTHIDSGFYAQMISAYTEGYEQ